MAEITFVVKQGEEARSTEATLQLPEGLPISKELIGESIVQAMEDIAPTGAYNIVIS